MPTAIKCFGRVFVLSLLLFGGFAPIGCVAPTTNPNVTLQRAVDYLGANQGGDGGWHSPTYGFLRDGQAWTPFIVYQLALAATTDGILVPDDALERGAEFIRAHVSDAGVLGTHDPDIMEYPNYATSYGVKALLLVGSPEDDALLATMVEYLLGQQYVEMRGILPSNVGYGAWGFGEKTITEGVIGHLDLSHTRRVLEALREYSDSDSFERHSSVESTLKQRIIDALAASNVFLGVAQKHPSDARPVIGDDPQNLGPYDGGFYSSPVVHGTNKAGRSATVDGVEYFNSYATTTCDGLVSLLTAGATLGDERVQMAISWLTKNPALDRPEGIAPGQPGDWDRVMFFYHLASRASVYNVTSWPAGGRETIASLLESHQQPDGSYSNPDGALNKEDDPMLATALAVEALRLVVENSDR